MAASQQQQPSSSQTTKLSKRQKRALGSNPSTAWQQQPRIKSANARARAYINYANLADDKKKKQTVQELLNPTLSLHSPEVKFGRLLGGTDQHARHGAVKMLREYLRARSDFTNGGQGLSELDLLKLWKVRLVVHTYTLPALVSFFYIAVFSHQSFYSLFHVHLYIIL